MAAESMFDKFLLASVVLQAAWAPTCTEGSAPTNCKTGKCVSIGEDRVCTECGKAGEVPINGECKAYNDAATTKDAGAGCETGGDASKAVDNTAVVCGKCSSTTDNYFLFMGGCYDKTKSPGNKICTAASGGKCTACKTDGSYIFKNPANAPTLGSECILCSDATDRNGYKGVAGCSQCTKADGTAGAATCSACQAGYVKDQTNNECKPCGTGCSACSADNTAQCSACLEGKYLDGTSCVDASSCTGAKYPDPKTNKCIQCNAAAEQGGIPECTACTYSDSLQKPVCSACNTGGSKPLLKTAADGTTTCEADCGDGYFQHIATGGLKTCQSCATASGLNPSVTGIPGCASCTYTSSTLKCTACGEGKKPNKEGTRCFDCGISGCAYCSGAGKCEACGDGYRLESGTCAPVGGNLSTGAIAGISVAAVVVIGGLVGFLCWWFVCRGKA